MAHLRPILLAEDNPNDVELTLSALHSLNLANEIVVVNDGAQALDFLLRRNAYRERAAVARRDYSGLERTSPARALAFPMTGRASLGDVRRSG